MGSVGSGTRGPVTALLAALAVALSLLAGCGGSDDDVSPNADRLLDRVPADQPAGTGPGGTGPRANGVDPVDACGLLTDIEVGGAAAGAVHERSAGTSTTGDPLCTWDVVHGKEEAPLAKVTVIVYEDGQVTFDADKNDSTSEPVPGLGDASYWHGLLSVLNVLVGDRNLTLQVTDPDGGLGRPPKDVAVDLARAALTRLPGAPPTTAP